MDFKEIIASRRSIRKYKPENPPEEWVEELVDCARQAPSPSNRQPVGIVKIESEERKNALHEAMVKGRDELLDACEKQGNKKMKNRINVYYRYADFMFSAPWLFLLGTVSSKPGFAEHLKQAGLTEDGNQEQAPDDITVGLYLGNMLSKAAELGLGTCVLTAPMKFIPNISEILGLSDMQPKCFLTAGYPDEDPKMPTRKPVEEILGRI